MILDVDLLPFASLIAFIYYGELFQFNFYYFLYHSIFKLSFDYHCTRSLSVCKFSVIRKFAYPHTHTTANLGNRDSTFYADLIWNLKSELCNCTVIKFHLCSYCAWYIWRSTQINNLWNTFYSQFRGDRSFKMVKNQLLLSYFSIFHACLHGAHL